MSVHNILDKIQQENIELTETEIIELLSIDNFSEDFYRLISASNVYSRKTFDNKGYIFVQIGLNTEPCSGNCLFCSMGAGHFSVNGKWRKNPDEIVDEIKKVELEDINDVFLMTTADYPLNDYLQVVKKVKPLLNERLRLVANIADFNLEEAKMLKEAGITGAYHVNRLREGVDTSLKVETRLQTLEAIKLAGLELYYCIEPIGAEHTYDEILTEILRAKYLHPEVMAVMRRVNYLGSPMSDRKMVSAIELIKIAAVTNLVVKPSRAMNLHESEPMSLLAGINQLYAEMGANPRDINEKTELSRGISINQAKTMLVDAGYVIH